MVVCATTLRYTYIACLVQYSHKWSEVRYRLRRYCKNGMQFIIVNINSIIGRSVRIFQFQICSKMSLNTLLIVNRPRYA
jgi:hypothetical protein